MKVQAAVLRAFVKAVSIKAGMGEHEADIFAGSLLYADLRGVHSHGVSRLEAYLRRIREGMLIPGVQPEVVRDGGALLQISGHNGVGAYVAQCAMERCIERASQVGVCIAGVNHANHFGCASYFTQYAAQHHMIGFAMANSPKVVAAFGGAEPVFGTNPLAVSIPAGERHVFDLDMATSVVAQGKIILARKEGHDVPLGWGVDSEGRPSTDPNAILDGGMLLPFGGAKGYGIALMIEMLCVCLAGSAKSTEMGSMYGSNRPQETGFVLGAIDYSKIWDAETFEDNAQDLLDGITGSKHAQGVERIYSSGELEQERSRQAEIEGVDISEPIIAQMVEIGQTWGVPYTA